MPEIDDETMARVLQWCAEAGRRSSPEEVYSALSGLSWDALLAVRAVLADEPPARPLGPFALADLARGVPADVAAERQRQGAYGPPGPGDDVATEQPASTPVAPENAPLTKKTRGRATRRVATVVIRRARDRREEPAATAPPPPLLDELFASEGRAVLQQWIRRHGARRARIAEELARWQRPDGAPAGVEDLSRLLDAHGLTRPFVRREREEVLHAVRAAGGRLTVAARALGVSPEALQEDADRLGITRDVEVIREERREDIRRRATLGDRVRMLVDEGERIEDLGMTAEVDTDLRARLAEHLKALRAAGTRHLDSSFARTLGITREQAADVAARFGIDLRDRAGPAMQRAPSPLRGNRSAEVRTSRPPRPYGVSPGRAGGTGARPGGSRPPGAKYGNPRSPGSSPGAPRRADHRADEAMRKARGERPGAGPRTGADRPGAPRPGGFRPAASRPVASRPAGSSPAASRAGGGPRPGGRTPAAGRPGARTAAPRRGAPRPRKPPRR